MVSMVSLILKQVNSPKQASGDSVGWTCMPQFPNGSVTSPSFAPVNFSPVSAGTPSASPFEAPLSAPVAVDVPVSAPGTNSSVF